MSNDDIQPGTKVRVTDGHLKGHAATVISRDDAQAMHEAAGTTFVMRQVGADLVWIKFAIFGRDVAAPVRRCDVVIAPS